MANAVLLVELCLSHAFVAEGLWWTMLLTYSPQGLFLVPTVPLLLSSLRRSTLRHLALNCCAAVFGLFGLMGLAWHPLLRPPPGPRLRAMTYNVEGYALGPRQVAQTILEQNPDVVCLQEAGSRFDELQPLLKGYRSLQRGDLVTATRLPIGGQRVHALPPGQDALCVTVLAGGEPVEIVNVHLIPTYLEQMLLQGDPRLSGRLARTAVAHERQMRAVMECTLPVRTPLLLCGDFNAPPLGIQYRRLTGYLTDSFAAAGSGFGYTVPAGRPLIRIDFVFTNEKLRPVAAWVPPAVSSDHRAVVAEFSRP